MADEIPDSRFKSEVMILLGKLVTRSDQTTRSLETLRSDVSDLRSNVEGLRSDVDGLRSTVGGLRTDVDGLRTDVDSLRTDVEGLRSDSRAIRSDLTSLTGDVKHLSRQFNDVGVMAINDHTRIDKVEERLSALEGEVH